MYIFLSILHIFCKTYIIKAKNPNAMIRMTVQKLLYTYLLHLSIDFLHLFLILP
jgi:hypothetical protein